MWIGNAAWCGSTATSPTRSWPLTIATKTWKVYPLPRQRFFTRDIEIDEADGAIYTTNSHFPTWQSEGGVPTLLRLRPLPQ